MPQRVFISRNENQVKKLIAFCSRKNWSLTAKSLISFKPLSFDIPKKWDVIFFPSSRAAQFFLASCSPVDLAEKKIACAGMETAKSITNYSDLIDFIPTHPGNIESVRVEFQQWLGKRNVIYAGSNLAQKSVLKNLPESQWEYIQVYATEIQADEIPICDVYIFSSPSNVASFLTKNEFPNNAKIIAWGKTTAKELEKNGLHIYATLENSDESELIDYLSKLN